MVTERTRAEEDEMNAAHFPDESDETGSSARGPVIAGVHVREEDLEPQKGLHVAAVLFRICAAVILALAAWQLAAWWMDPPPGGIGVGVLVGDTIRLIVFAGLLWAAGDLAALLVTTHYDIRATRILTARQTYMMRQMGVRSGELPANGEEGHRRVDDPDMVASFGPGAR